MLEEGTTDVDEVSGPAADLGERLAAMCSEVLGGVPATPRDDFFALGGTSLAAVRLTTRLRAELGLEVALRTVFDHPRLPDLALVLDAGRAAGAAAVPAVPEDPPPVGSDTGEGLLSYEQERLWLLDRLDEHGSSFVLGASRRWDAQVRPEDLALAVGDLVSREDALRTRFVDDAGDPRRMVAPAAPGAPFALEAGPAGAADEDLDAWHRELTSRPFDLAAGPLLRVGLADRGDGRSLVVLAVHHIVADGWSLGGVFDRLHDLWSARARGAAPAAPVVRATFGDWVSWQRRRWSGQRAADDLAWWSRELAGAPPVLELPRVRPRGSVPAPRADPLEFELPGATARAVANVAAARSTTPFVVLLSAFSTLLSRYAGTSDVVVGTPVANRPHPAFEDVFGFFVNTVALRTDLSGRPSGDELLRRAQRVTVEAFAHSEAPFGRVVEAVSPPRDLAVSPVFQVMFALHDAPGQSSHTAPGAATLGGTGTATFDLALLLRPGPDGYRCTLDVNPGVFDRDRAEAFGRHYRVLLDDLLARPDAPVADLELLDPPERDRVVHDWNRTAVDRDVQTLDGLVVDRARRCPDATALVAPDGTPTTYGELLDGSARVAHGLRARGVATGELVGLACERSPEMLIALLGVLRAGAAYLPLDVELPAARLGFVLADSGVRTVLGQRAVLGRLPAADGVELVDVGELLRDPAPSDVPEPPRDPHRTAYVMYTSGSTGRPKGVVTEHGPVVNRVQWMSRALPAAVDEVVVQKTPIHFDVSVWEYLWPLASGAVLVLARPGGHREPAYLVDLARRHAVTTMHFVPSMLSLVLEQTDLGRCGSLRRVLCSGEALDPHLAARAAEALPGLAVHNLYGPTEAAIEVSHWERTPADTDSVPIGRPIDNARLYVVDDRDHPVPVGVAGELCIGGLPVARGYLNRPELTAERFVPDPFVAGGRIYRTGDRARWRADGAVEFLGRLDDQVKLRGTRIELGEVEGALLALPEVAAAAVTLRGAVGDQYLAGYVVPRAEGAASAPGDLVRRLHAALGDRLPQAAIPTRWSVLDALPVTASGKTDRAALTDPPAPESGAGGAGGTAATDEERGLATIWAALLGGEPDRFGLDDDFFAVGGHSLAATRVLARVRDDFGVLLGLREVFENPTLGALAARVAEAVEAEVREAEGLLAEIEALSDEEVRNRMET